MFGGLFGKPKPKKGGGGGRPGGAPDLNKSIQTLRTAITQLDKREAHLEKKIAACLAKARQKSKSRDKKGALFELKKKKQLEKQLESIQGKKLNLETQIMTLEDAHLNKATLDAMRTSAAAIRSTVRDADLDRADELMDELNEAMDQVQEMNDAMSQPLGMVMDDAELEDELAELEEMDADELLQAMPDAGMKVAPTKQMDAGAMLADMPAAPSAPVASSEDKELAELEAMMG